MQKVLIIVGPTAVGKTKLGVALSQQLNGEIISGDSMQIYREISVGTAKPSEAELAMARHHLVNELSVFDSYSVKDFVARANAAIGQINAAKHLPLVVGGTGFYITALVNGLQLGEQETYDSPVDEQIEQYLVRAGPLALWQQLHEQDPQAAAKIPYQNTRRVMRALSVMERTGHPFSQQQEQIAPLFDTKIIGLNTERAHLYDLINRRVDTMLEQGLLAEAEFIFTHKETIQQVKQAIGYKELFPYFEGEQTLDEAVAKLKQASRKYAKRQLTYFRNKMSVSWYDLTDYNPDAATDFAKIKQEVIEWLNNDK